MWRLGCQSKLLEERPVQEFEHLVSASSAALGASNCPSKYANKSLGTWASASGHKEALVS